MPGHEAAALLRTNAMFAALPGRELAALTAAALEESYRVREYVFMEGDPALWFYIVRSGRVKILRNSRTGRDGGGAVVKAPAGVVVPLTEPQPSIIKEMALMIGRRLRSAHDSVKSLAVD